MAFWTDKPIGAPEQAALNAKTALTVDGVFSATYNIDTTPVTAADVGAVPAPAPVLSVNGLGGAVLLGAADVGAADAYPLAVGESTFPRIPLTTGVTTFTSQSLYLNFFTARKTEVITQLRTWASTAATATPTLCRLGVYAEGPDYTLTLVASTANDTSLWATANIAYLTSLTLPWAKQARQRYAIGTLVVSGVAGPALYGPGGFGNAAVAGAILASHPRVFITVASQADLPSTIAPGTSSAGGPRPSYVEMVPSTLAQGVYRSANGSDVVPARRGNRRRPFGAPI